MSKYFLYARKSTDEQDRQILSIESQLVELQELAKKEKITVIQEFIESRTAKIPGRPVFNEMIARIEKGEADGILAWHPDRLARNSIDGGKIIYLVDTGKIKDLKFPTFRFDNTAYGKFMLSIAFSQSKYYVDNLSENIKRGIRQKLRRGEWSALAPIGYLNDPKTRKVVLDNKKYYKVKKIFELYAIGNYSLPTLVKVAKKMNLANRSGKNLRIHSIEQILDNPFYYGVLKWKGEIYEGIHPPIISKKLYDRVQEVRKQRARPTRKKKKDFVFRGNIYCGECGAMITADTHKGYNYYHCTGRKTKCSQNKYIREEELAYQMAIALSKIWLNDKTKSKMTEYLEKCKEKESGEIISTTEKLETELKTIDEKLERLLDGYISGIVGQEEYQAKKENLINRKFEIRQKMESLTQNTTGWLEPTKEVVMTCNSVEKIVKAKNYQKFVEIGQKAGSNFVLRDKKLNFVWKKPFNFFSGEGKFSFSPTESANFFDSFLPASKNSFQRFTSRLFSKTALIQGWWRRRESNPRPEIFQQDIYRFSLCLESPPPYYPKTGFETEQPLNLIPTPKAKAGTIPSL
ncbi:hypothetical protein ES705_38824 [subsurface metagenome]